MWERFPIKTQQTVNVQLTQEFKESTGLFCMSGQMHQRDEWLTSNGALVPFVALVNVLISS